MPHDRSNYDARTKRLTHTKNDSSHEGQTKIGVSHGFWFCHHLSTMLIAFSADTAGMVSQLVMSPGSSFIHIA